MLKSTPYIVAALLCVGGCQQSLQDLGGSPSASLTDGDNNWFKMITESNMTEIKTSQMALTQSQDPAVKQLAQKMIDDHIMAGNEVQTLATAKHVMVPTALDSKHQSIVDSLKDKSGTDFDKAFETAQVMAHQETIKFDQNESDNGTDPQVKMMAAKLLDTLKMHLQMVQQFPTTGSSGM